MTQAQKRSAVARTLLRWALFGLLVSVTPLIANELVSWGRSDWLPYDDLVGRGELLLVSAGVVAASLGELFGGEGAHYPAARIVIVGVSVFLISASAYWFADISGAVREGEKLNTGAIALGSSVMFIFAVILGACSMIVAEVSRWR